MTTAMKANPVNPVNPVKKNCPNGNYLGGTRRLTQEARDVIDASGLGTNNLCIIYVPGKIIAHDIDNHGTDARFVEGLAFAFNFYEHAADSNYVDTCFVSAHAYNNHIIPAHEIVHLLGEDHVAEMWNLVFGWSGLSNPHPWNDVRGMRRLTQEQRDRIRRNDLNRNKLK